MSEQTTPETIASGAVRNASSCLVIDQNASFGDMYDAVTERLGKADSILSLTADNAEHEAMDRSTLVLPAVGSGKPDCRGSHPSRPDVAGDSRAMQVHGADAPDGGTVMNQEDFLEHIDRKAIGARLWRHREELRELPAAINVALGVARDMYESQQHSDPRPPDWCNQRGIDGVLACAQGAAEKLYYSVIDLVGESDSDMEARPRT